LAPHTSGGVLGRIIGFTKAHVCYAHPYYHAAKRRNCDGDEDSLMLLLDGLLNFSRSYLPGKRGGLMDAPLVLTIRIEPDEIDKEALNLDMGNYPIEFYEATIKNTHPKEIESFIDKVGDRVGKDCQYEDFKFSHDTMDIGEGPKLSAYKTLGSMIEKMDAQLNLARKIRAVSEDEVASRVISTHFLPDLIGNLRAFSKQTVRCVKCNAKYRRIPLKGVCTQKKGFNVCGGKLTLTVHEGGVRKYMKVTKEVLDRYDISNYTKQRVLLIEKSITSTFENDKVKQIKIEDFF
ncbi:MAG: DNA polymerase II large subunit, partial [Bacteroidetes bacterium]|nr:DNA polymerase II large subunit [Bacteroidota bacterium]